MAVVALVIAPSIAIIDNNKIDNETSNKTNIEQTISVQSEDANVEVRDEEAAVFVEEPKREVYQDLTENDADTEAQKFTSRKSPINK